MGDYQFLIANNENGVLADLTDYAYDKVVGPRLSRPSESSFRVPLVPEVLAMGGGDGYPLFWPGLRRIIVNHASVGCVANDILWGVQPKGGPDDAWLECIGFGPMIRWQTRWCQDVNAQVFDGPSADGTDRGLDLPAGIIANPNMTVVAAQMLKQAIDNTIANDGPVGCTTGGTFSDTPTPGGNVAFAMRNLSPLRLGDLASLFEETGVCDITIAPTAGGGESQGAVSAVNRAGTDLPGVSFDYGTGARNVAWAYPEASMDNFANKIWYELGRNEGGSHFANNVTRDAPGVTVDDSGSRSAYGVYHDIVLKNEFSGKIRNTSNLFKMYVRLYNAELAARMVPRQVIKIVPQPGLAPRPWINYNLGDTPRANLANLGISVADANFRIIGWDVHVDNDGPENVELQIGWSPS